MNNHALRQLFLQYSNLHAVSDATSKGCATLDHLQRYATLVTAPAVNHSLPPPATVASPLACVGGPTTGLMVHVPAVHPDSRRHQLVTAPAATSFFGAGPHHVPTAARNKSLVLLVIYSLTTCCQCH